MQASTSFQESFRNAGLYIPDFTVYYWFEVTLNNPFIYWFQEEK